MAFGIGAPGKSPEMHAGEVRFRTLAEYREQIRQISRQGLVDIMLMSASTQRRADDPRAAVRQQPRHAGRPGQRHQRHLRRPRRPLRRRAVAAVPHGDARPHPVRPPRLRAGRASAAAPTSGLYSVTFNNHLDDDLRDARRVSTRSAKRPSARAFATSSKSSIPTRRSGLTPSRLPQFINDSIARTLAGVAAAGRPLFLKIVYHGPQAMEELVAYDPHLVVGILGGSAGTTYDAFKLIAEAQKYGARVALFGRKINNAEIPAGVRRVPAADRRRRDHARKRPCEAYHGVLQQLGDQAAALAGRRPAAANRRDELRRRLDRRACRPAFARGNRRPSNQRQPATRAAAHDKPKDAGEPAAHRVPLPRQAGGDDDEWSSQSIAQRQARLLAHDASREAGLQQSSPRSDLRLIPAHVGELPDIVEGVVNLGHFDSRGPAGPIAAGQRDQLFEMLRFLEPPPVRGCRGHCRAGPGRRRDGRSASKIAA